MRDECLTLVITDLRTGSKEGQEDRQQNQSVENPQDGEDRQDSKEVSGKQKGSGTVSEKQAFCPPGTQMLLCTKGSAQQPHCSEKSATKLQFKL